MNWQGVMPAITTPFEDDGSIDLDFVARHVRWLVEHGCTGIVPCGSLGEGATLDPQEKVELIATCVEALEGKAPVIPGLAATSTRTAVWLCEQAQAAGAQGLMILPPYVHKGPDDEIAAHFEAMLAATDLPCMLYNNPPAYGFDAEPAFIAELAERHPNLAAVKESSGDVRRVTAVRALCGDRLALFAGLDDMVVEAVVMGADGWIAGLVNALPAESVRLFELAKAGRFDEAFALYRWFLPLLRLDTLPEFVQWIKLVQAEVGPQTGLAATEVLRPPRQPVQGAEREEGLRWIRALLEQER
ncbi:MAG TPA: dihydrodipicolinate synthase family protein [Thermoanaerobaculia bacterium]|nr:dihydrodipicolinate synthase family protein [Thermoanaerobaculia bacterium]